MKKSFVFLVAVMVGCVFFSGIVLSPNQAEAKKAKNIVFGVAGPMYPEFAESYSYNAVMNHLLGRMQTDPALKGKYNLKIMDKGILYPTQDEHLQALSRGSLQMTYTSPHFLEALEEPWKLGEAPGAFRDWNHYLRTMDTPAWQALHEKMAKKHNVSILKWTCDIGIWYFFAKKPMNSLADIKGMKMRYAGGEAHAKALKALGTTPISIPYTEVVTALQTNMVEALITDFTGGVSFYGLPRYTHHTLLVPIAIQPMCIIAGTKWWEGLDKDARASIQTVLDVMEVQPFYERHQGKMIQKWKDDPKLFAVDPSKAMVDKWQAIMVDSLKDMTSKIESQFTDAVRATRD
jgi:TRAP-type C4-dicarboxylate transport system substrate-binding protein